MLPFNETRSDTNPFNKKGKKQDINEQIDRLTQFYNALESDTNMAYVIDELEKVHDKQVAIHTEIILLNEELLAFEKVFDEKNSYTDEALDKIRDSAIENVSNSIKNNIQKDTQSVKEIIQRAQMSALDSIEAILSEAKKRVKHNNKVYLDIKMERKNFNYLGFIILAGSILVSSITFSYLAESTFMKKEYNKLVAENNRLQEKVHYLHKQSIQRDELIGAIVEELERKK